MLTIQTNVAALYGEQNLNVNHMFSRPPLSG